MTSTNTTHGRRGFVKPVAIYAFAILSLALLFATLIGEYRSAHGDFKMRYNEVACLKARVNPYQVWRGEVLLDGFRPHRPMPDIHDGSNWQREFQRTGQGGNRETHAYTPWQYTFFLPLSFFTQRTAESLFFGIQIIALALIWYYGFQQGRQQERKATDGLFVASACISAGMLLAIKATLNTGNYGITHAALLFIFARLIDKKHDCLAGVCWAFIMVKPQVGVLLAIPLLIGRKYKTIAVAVVTCLIATLPPAWLARTSPITLILNVKDAGSPYFKGSGIVPSALIDHFEATIPNANTLAILLSAILGIALCIGFSWHLRRAPWIVRITPAIICSLIWTYSTITDKIILAIPISLVSTWLLNCKTKKEFLLLAFSLVFLLIDVVFGNSFSSLVICIFPVDSVKLKDFLTTLHTYAMYGQWIMALLAVAFIAHQDKSLSSLHFSTRSTTSPTSTDIPPPAEPEPRV